MKVRHFFAITLAAAALGLLVTCTSGKDAANGGQDAGQPNNGENSQCGTGAFCSVDSDCPCAEDICQQGACLVPECKKNKDCPADRPNCLYNQCQAEEQFACDSDGRCLGSREKCLDGFCAAVGCRRHTDCPADQYCDGTWACAIGGREGTSCTAEDDCGAEFICFVEHCFRLCTTSGQCQEPLACEFQEEINDQICRAKICHGDNECGAGTMCNLESGACVPDTRCKSDADCPGEAKPKCETLSGACVECLVSGDCLGTNAICDPAQHECLGGEERCYGDDVCVDPAKPHCSLETGICEEPPPPICTANEQCTGTSTPVCDTANGECVECLANDDCPPAQTCNEYSMRCFGAGCETDQDCPPELPNCELTGGECVECLGDIDCQYGRCDPATHACPVGEGEGTPVPECTQCTSGVDCGMTTGMFCQPPDLFSQMSGLPGSCQIPCQGDAECVNSLGTKVCTDNSAGGFPGSGNNGCQCTAGGGPMP